MTSNRPYQPTEIFKEALKEILKEAGKQFDPQVVEAFLKVLKERKIIK